MRAELNTARQVFEEALAAFAQRRKLVGTERYDDLRGEEHYRAFAVAGAMKADLLADLHEAVRKAVVDHGTIQDFRRDFADIVQRRGWSGWTGEGTRQGELWRTRVIYTTNARKSFSTGRYVQLTDPAVAAVLPYWRWRHSGTARDPRPEHQAWDGMTLHHTDPFWRTHFPPRIPPDYGCGCSVEAVRGPAPDARTTPPDGWEADADPGAGAPPADVVEDIRQMIRDKQARLPAPLARDLGKVVTSFRLEQLAKKLTAAAARTPAAPVGAALAEFAVTAREVADRKVEAAIGPVQEVERIRQETGYDLAGYRHVLDNYAVRHTLKHHGNPQTEAARGQIAISPEDFGVLPQILGAFDRVFADGKNKVGRDVLVFTKVIDGVGYRYVAELRPGKKLVATDSMRKKSGAWEN